MFTLRCMKTLPALFLVLLFPLLTAHAELRQFTNRDGTAIQARLIRLEGEMAVIEREDRKIYRVPIGIFSDEDQAYLRRWPVVRALRDEVQTEFRTRRVRIDRREARESALYDPQLFYRRAEENLVFQIVAVNRSNVELEDVTVEYQVLLRRAQHVRGDRVHEERVRGVVKIPRVRRGAEVVENTDSIIVVNVDRDVWVEDVHTGQMFTRRLTTQDEIVGIAIRLLEGEEVIREEMFPPTLGRRIRW
jgi:hypothetical protein